MFLAYTTALSTTYYVDAQNGNDNNNGLASVFQGGSSGPWKTIGKVNGTTFAPGDSILFKRGAVWTDGPLEPRNGGAPGGIITIQETILGQPISFDLVDPNNHNCVYFGAYGTSTAKPKIDCQGEKGIVIGHNYIIVEGLHIDNGGNNMLWINRDGGINWVNVKDVDVTNCSSNAVRFNGGGGNIWLKGLYVYDYGTNGILMSGSENNLLKHVLVEECWVENPVIQDLEDAITCHRLNNTYDLEGYIIIRKNTIRRSGEDGIDVTSGTHILLDGNDIRYSFSAGILLSKDWVNTIEVRNNFLFSNSYDQGNGDLSIRVPNVWAYNNVIAGNGHNCLSFSDTDNTKFWNNVIAPMNRTGNLVRFTENVGNVELKNNIFDFSLVDQEIHIETPGPNIVFDNNCYFGTSAGQSIYDNLSFQEYRNVNPLFEPNGFWGDPQFINPGRTSPDFFRLASTSPCIDRGVSVPVLLDFWGTPRPQGAQIDIGIYEQSALDCNPDPNITTFPGDPCDDGDPTTINDMIDANCNCAGTPTACTGFGDADGDGVCTNVDCDDNDPNIAYQPGDPCNDGNPNTVGETIQTDCSCGGGTPAPQTTLTCSRVNASADDAEEHSSGYVSLTSSDLELANDPGRGNQQIGMLFRGLNIPQGATIINAYIQFTSEDDANDNPCNLSFSGQASDNPSEFNASYQNVSTRPRTNATVNWAPEEWLSTGAAGGAQMSPNLSAILQEIVNRGGYAPANPIVILVEGTGRRVAESFDGSSSKAPELCVEYTTSTMSFDCPTLFANIGDLCNDGNANTINDMIDANCNCVGTLVACPGVGDNDGDGICADVDCDDNNPNITTVDMDGDGLCADVDCDDNNPNITTQPGQACNDGDNTTINDVIDANCNCVGTPTTCTGIGDADGDGVCADVDCDDNNPNITTQPGQACNDGDNTTINDVIDANCNCVGTPTACTGIGDADGDGVCADVDCDDNNPNITTQPGQACNDNDPTTINDVIDANCNCAGTPTDCTGIGDSDGDGVCDDVDCDINNPNITTQPGQACNDNDPTTVNDQIDANCNCVGTPTACTGIGDADGDGVCADVDCDDNNPNITTQPGQACNDNDPTTVNDQIDANCNCVGTPTACTGIGDADGDGVCADVDCDDNNPNITTQPGQACNDNDPTTVNDQIDANCNCVGTPTACTGIGDADGDGVCADVDCDDNNPNITTQPGQACNDNDPTTVNDQIDANCNCVGTPTACTGIGDADGDGVCADVDCDDNNPNITTQPGQACSDGNPNTINDFIDENCNCVGGTLIPCPGVGDNDGDGLCADLDCDDNDPNVTTQPGDPCNDGNPNTIGETIQADCSCGGGVTGMAPKLTCSQINSVRDDAEESPLGQIRLASNDLELVNDSYAGNQVVGLRFNGLNIPRDAYIISAKLQFTAESISNENPADLIIRGEASNDGATFRGNSFHLSSRPRTNASVNWLPSEWTSSGASGFAQQSPDISPIIQEIVNRGGFTSNSSVVLFIEGTGRRSAESFEGFASRAPKLCVEYLNAPPGFDCPVLQGNVGTPCDDGNPGTHNDVIDANCNCTGTPTTCQGIGDVDGDGVCADTDCNDNDPNITHQPGDVCDDGDPNTIGETIQADCSCGGGVAAPSLSCAKVNSSSDDAEEGPAGQVNLSSEDLEMAASNSFGSQVAGMRFNGLNIPQGSRILKASIQFTVEDTQNGNLCTLRVYGEDSDNASTFTNAAQNISSRPVTEALVEWMPSSWLTLGESGQAQESPDLSPILQEIVNRSGYTSASSIAILIDGFGRRSAQSFDGSSSQAPELCVEYIAPATNARPGSPGLPAGGIQQDESGLQLPASSGQELSSLSIYPNPASGWLALSFNSTIECPARVQAIDMSGKVVLLKEGPISQGENEIRLEHLSLPDGIYVLQVIAGGTVQSEKFVIMKE
ncbi:MAG: T9SS type A sorting domain-containing protein [Lewinellaceae bacterium]|nr:T9SS type A sorting domain-containing protein [Lewinellaceae bacterium]